MNIHIYNITIFISIGYIMVLFCIKITSIFNPTSNFVQDARFLRNAKPIHSGNLTRLQNYRMGVQLQM